MEWWQRSFPNAFHDKTAIASAQSADVNQCGIDLSIAKTAGYVIEIATGIGYFVIGGGRDDPILKA
jgi:hypothetical protein